MFNNPTARNRTVAALAAIAAATIMTTASAGAEGQTPAPGAATPHVITADPGTPGIYKDILACTVEPGSGSSTGSTGLCGPRPVTRPR
ncbi:hypothetical protein IU471_22560 [Nocardia elegans]|nr:hypothetical protein [Nocardia elegans]MBF6246351.1 hypothetical protein [Nocardia elegans]PEH74561.1 hypothetical protein CRM89_29940 [Nocardia sp. FDAARGOS_372]